MLFHSEFKMIPRRQGGSDGGVFTDTLRKLTTQPTQVELEDGMEYAHDPFGRRLSKTLIKDEIGTECQSPNICPRTTNYVYDGQNIILEYQNGNITARYTQGLNIDEPLAVTQNTNTYFYHTDGLGSITALTNTSGTVVQTYSYDSFGNMTTTGNINQPFTYTAREFDTETGMYFYRARYYDSKVGRFVTRDPIGFTGGDYNLYVYVGNNPVNFIDPVGLFTYGDNAGGPVNPRVANALTCFENCIGSPVTVTGAQECGPPHVPGSAHCSGEACDLGRNNNPQLNSDNVAHCFSQCSGANGFAWGYAGGPNFHMQTRPGAGGTTGFRR